MKVHHQLPAVLCLVLIVGGAACRNSKKKAAVDTTAAQDTMLLRDLAEANRNTAAAASVDNSLNTVRTSGDGLPPDLNAASQARSSDTRVVPRTPPSGSELLTSGRRLPPKSSDSGSSGSSSSSGNPCDSPAAVDQRSCLNRSIVQNDADLNRTYQDLIAQSKKSGGPELEQRFREAQRDWVNQRDVECRGVGEGALWARARARCLADHSDKRAAELRRSLNSLRGQGQ